MQSNLEHVTHDNQTLHSQVGFEKQRFTELEKALSNERIESSYKGMELDKPPR